MGQFSKGIVSKMKQNSLEGSFDFTSDLKHPVNLWSDILISSEDKTCDDDVPVCPNCELSQPADS